NHRLKFALPQEKRAACEIAQPRDGLARYRNANESARSRQLHRHDRTSTGSQSGVSRRGGVADEIHHPIEPGENKRATPERRLSRLLANGLRGRTHHWSGTGWLRK